MSDPSSPAVVETPRRKAEAAKRPRNSAKTKASIRAAARGEFADRGAEGARVDAIADRAGANKRLLYHYFGNKDDLYLAVLEEAYTAIRAAESELVLSRSSPASMVK